MTKKNRLIYVGIILLILFFAFTIFIHLGKFVSTDLSITHLLQNFFPRIVDTPFSLFSLIGSLETASLILLIIWALYRKLNFIIVLGFFGVMHVVELFAKSYVLHFPPPFKFFRYDLDLQFPSSYVRPGYSYPSGHASRTAFLSVLILLLVCNSKRFTKNQKLLIVSSLLIFDVIMFLSRIYLGEHWASDVIGGILIGTSLSIISSSGVFSKKSRN